MANQHIKRISNKKSAPEQKDTYLHQNNWEVMKPFVHFAVKATAIIGSTLFGVVKLFPKALEHKPEERNNNKIIKI